MAAGQARIGSIDALGDPENKVPFFKRYFLGGATNLRGTDGARVVSSRLLDALRGPESVVRIPREEAGQFGLPSRTALAGLSRVQVGDGKTWDVVAVARSTFPSALAVLPPPLQVASAWAESAVIKPVAQGMQFCRKKSVDTTDDQAVLRMPLAKGGEG